MGNDHDLEPQQSRKNGWGLLGVAAAVGLLAAVVVVAGRSKRGVAASWSVDDLIDAADRAAETLERALTGETARAS